MALIADKTSLPVLIGWLIGPLAAGFAAVVLGLLTRRLSGLYLAAITYLFAQAFQSWLNSAPGITGGEAGIGNLRPTSLFGWIPGDRGEIVLAVVLVLRRRVRARPAAPEPVGRVAAGDEGGARSRRGDGHPRADAHARRARSRRRRGSLGGALFTTATSVITPSTFTLNLMFLAVFMSLLGGQGTPWGAIAGAVLIVELTLNVPYLSTSGSLLVAAVVLLVMLLAPNGVLGILNVARTWVMRARRWPATAARAVAGEDGS